MLYQSQQIEEACRNGDAKMLEFISSESSISLMNQSNDEGLYPIHTSVLYNEWPKSEELLYILKSNGANLNYADPRSGDTLLHLVLQFNNSTSIRYLVPFLLEQGCSPYSGQSAIDIANNNGYSSIVPVMFDYKSSDYVYSDYRPTKKQKPIQKETKPKVQKEPEEKKPEVPPINYEELNQSLVKSIIIEDLWTMKKLMEEGANPNFKDQNECCPLHFAVSKRQADPLSILKELKNFNPDFNAITQEGDTVLTLAIKKIENEEVCFKVVEYLKKSGVPYALKDQDGYDAYTLAKLRNFKTILPLFPESFKKENKQAKAKKEVPKHEAVVAPSFGVQNSSEKEVKSKSGFCIIV